MSHTARDIEHTVSSGDVFADLGVTNPEEAGAKAELARRISASVVGCHLTQAAAAELLGIEQPKVSALMHGRLTGLSMERLIRFLTVLDRDVEIVAV